MLSIAAMGALAFLLSLQTSSTYATVVYTAPFVVFLAIAIPFKNAIVGRAVSAAVGATIPIVLFHCLFLYDIWVRLPNEGGGANIGLGILLVFLMPFIVLVSAMTGWAFGGPAKVSASSG